MKSKSTKRALLASVLSMMLCCAMLIGTTFAWFTDSVTSGKNKIVAGNLDVELYAKSGDEYTPVTENTNLFLEDALWEPGHVEVINLKVANLGTLALKYKLGINIASENPGTSVETKEEFKLSDFIYFAVLDGEKTYTADAAGRAQAISDAESTAKKISEMTVDESGGLYPIAKATAENPSEKLVTLVAYMPTTVGNEANYITGTDAPEITLGVKLVATQTPFENDSFGNDYDSTAYFPIVADVHYDASTSDDLITALNNVNEDETTAIHLKNDLVLDQIGNPDDYWKYHYKFSGKKEVIIDLAGNELTFSKPDGADYSFNGGIFAENNSVTIANGTVSADGCTGVYTTGGATSYFNNVIFNVSGRNSYGVHGIGYTEFDNCEFNVKGNYGLFCSKATKVTNCIFNVNSFGSAGVQMNTYCDGNVISNCKFNVSYGTAIYVNNNSDVEINNVDIILTGNSSVAGIHVDPEKSFATIGENVTITNESTYYSPELVGGNAELSNIRIADGFKFETDGQLYQSKYGAYPSAKYEKGTYWRTVPAT